MLATHMDAERRYGKIRQETLKAAESVICGDYPQLKLTTLDLATLRAADAWACHPCRRVDWDWMGSYGAIKFRYPKRFEAAVWYKEKLNGLSLGRPTYNGGSLRLDFVEASPLNREIAIFDIIVVAMRTYADMLGAKELRIMHPINDRVKDYYASHGFTYVKSDNYLFRRI
ncbi:hypothetical protein BTA51_13340 [Hahella sp. CCB-MM4]|uniref:hypothetical protein n=1 Tax=Hahella sp. (strain CCB-MM4) TaxID=1926491 RepID=UPI000B9A4CB9|nr:hypothetical protein [Hahella sp. CCB-MM4]OZG72939.1 hypothetical protein BTA51_13340 [Hahella sp. CCB-MM4]